MEYMDGGSLADVLKLHKGGLSEPYIAELARQVGREGGLLYIAELARQVDDRGDMVEICRPKEPCPPAGAGIPMHAKVLQVPTLNRSCSVVCSAAQIGGGEGEQESIQ